MPVESIRPTLQQIEFRLQNIAAAVDIEVMSVRNAVEYAVYQLYRQAAGFDEGTILEAYAHWKTVEEAVLNLQRDFVPSIIAQLGGIAIMLDTVFQKHVTTIAYYQAQAETSIKSFIGEILDGVGNIVWQTETSLGNFIVSGLNHVVALLDVGLTSMAEGMKDILDVIPQRVWDYFWKWLQEDA